MLYPLNESLRTEEEQDASKRQEHSRTTAL